MKRSIFCLLLLAAAASASAQAQAARVNDLTDHSGIIVGPGVPTVVIGGRPAAVMGDLVQCPMFVSPGVPHVGGPIMTGSSTVLIGGRPAARVGDMVTENGPPATIIIGAPTVLIGP
jgi:uncharacterized Zn-binding protein involved in type VI secretion